MRTLGLLLVILLFAGAPNVLVADQLSDSLKTLRKVEGEGKGNAQAQEAWRKVAGADAAKLPEILAALDGAEPLAANWIRIAVDAIAERTITAGKPLPAKELEAFILDTSHAPTARRLAFEWLTRVDASAPDRLEPGFANDPSVELRRGAVARLIAAAAKQEAAKDAEGAKTMYRQALASARDVDQVNEITAKLTAAGDKVVLPRHFGFITRWKLIGPFDNVGGKGYDTAFPPEKEIQLDAEYDGKGTKVKWIDHETADPYGKVDFNTAIVKANGVTAYAFAEFNVTSDAIEGRACELRIGCICANKVWLNGELVTQHEVYHQGEELDQYVARARLKPGRNTILVKVCQNEQKEEWAQGWQFQLRVCDEVGTAVLAQDRPADQ